MKVLHISYTDSGGAGLCCLRIHKSLLEQGVDSKVVVFEKKTDLPEVYQYGSKVVVFIYKVISKLFAIAGMNITMRSKVLAMVKKNGGAYSSPLSPIDLTKCSLVEWADIIHLHWVNFYLDYPTFFGKVRKPMVWTLHDENLFCGAAHYTRDVFPNNKTEKYLTSLKTELIGSIDNIGIVFLSEYMHSTFHNYPIVNNKRQVVINNSVDGSKFHLYDKQAMRRQYDIPQSKIVVAFLAFEIFDPRKGLKALVGALQSRRDFDKFLILAIGGNFYNEQIPPMVKAVGRVNDSEELSRLLCCSDFFAMPSYQEGFAQSPMEAMACGLPVVAFPCSGTSELINESNGIICRDFTQSALEEGVERLLSRDYDAKKIRDYITSNFAPKVIAMKYMSLYSELLSTTLNT